MPSSAAPASPARGCSRPSRGRVKGILGKAVDPFAASGWPNPSLVAENPPACGQPGFLYQSRREPGCRDGRCSRRRRSGDMRLPVVIDVARHLQHAPRDLLGVDAVVGQVFGVVAIGAALLGRDPGGDRSHQRVELVDAEIGQHLHVLVDVGRACAVRRGFGNRVGQRVEGLQALDGGRRRQWSMPVPRKPICVPTIGG